MAFVYFQHGSFLTVGCDTGEVNIPVVIVRTTLWKLFRRNELSIS